mmetsp:Transcript_3203/g.7591  ORF Transcript_3203/g.7591 Transcript_3203/m.7591 type:complete len:441 (+) Transcript_3203:115-1437(+)
MHRSSRTACALVSISLAATAHGFALSPALRFAPGMAAPALKQSSARALSLAPRKFAMPRCNRNGLRLLMSTPTEVDWAKELIKDSDENNVTPYIANLVGRDLHLKKNHPLNIIKTKIEKYFTDRDSEFQPKDSLYPIVTPKQCFDDLLIPEDHQSRRFSDTYYISKEKLLRTHTSAHQTELLKQGVTKFLCTGDVYRRDEIDSSHYPAFHQMEGVKILKECEGVADREKWVEMCSTDLKDHLEGMVDAIFGPVEKRWVEAYFPFTDPSFELEIFYQGDWLEVLGCGVIQQPILDGCDMKTQHGWAFGLGLERLAMVLFDIPDIRLFWTDDERFISQFKDGEITKFEPYSKYPACYKDIAFWLPEGWEENNFAELVRNVAGDIVESVELVDKFDNPKKGKTSHCYRINYRAMDRSLTNEEVDKLQMEVRDKAAADLSVELR